MKMDEKHGSWNKSFMRQVKSLMGIMAIGGESIEAGESYQIRESSIQGVQEGILGKEDCNSSCLSRFSPPDSGSPISPTSPFWSFVIRIIKLPPIYS